MNKSIQEFFAQIEAFLKNTVAPISNELDSQQKLLKDCYYQLIQLGSLRFLIPADLGGLGGERREWIDYNMCMAEHSGALLFLQAQHQFTIWQLKKLLPDRG